MDILNRLMMLKSRLKAHTALALSFCVAFCYFWASPALSVDYTNLYLGSCEVRTGVILRVDKANIYYLNPEGIVKSTPRYEVVGIAIYSLPHNFINKISNIHGHPISTIDFKTLHQEHLETLARGWPIEYSGDSIQVLTTEGRDQIVQRTDIWDIDFQPASRDQQFTFSETSSNYQTGYLLRHPLAFESCPPVFIGTKKKTPPEISEKSAPSTTADGTDSPGNTELKTQSVSETGPSTEAEAIRLIPHSSYENILTLKKHFDHLQTGYQKLLDYEDRQRFYAVPEYFKNQTYIGTWAILGSRYSDVGGRQANFLPLVEDQYSEGPFGFQRIVRSGVSPIDWLMHEEPTVQVYYGLKADYIRFDFFFDPTAPLIGEQYDYKIDDLHIVDDRMAEKGGVRFGVDIGRWSTFVAFTSGRYALRANDFFAIDSFFHTRFGLSYWYNRYKVALSGGSNQVDLSEDLPLSLQSLRANIEFPILDQTYLKLFYINRNLKTKSSLKLPLHYESSWHTLATQVNHAFWDRWKAHGQISLEQQSSDAKAGVFNTSGSESKLWPKISGGIGILF